MTANGFHRKITLKLMYICVCISVTHSADENSSPDDDRGTNACDCMEYWTCIMRGGQPYSYCGLSESTVCCGLSTVNETLHFVLPSQRPNKRCGEQGRHSGKEGIAEPGEWPWHAAILEKPDELYVCGGSLVDEKWILTAAHCVDDYDNGKVKTLKVRLGEYDVSSTREELQHQEYDVIKVILHPYFNNSTLSNDVALLQLHQPVKFQPHINYVCLTNVLLDINIEKQGANNTNKCVITGWGRRTEASEHSVTLKEVYVPLWKNSDCENALRLQFGTNYKLPDNSICAGDEGKDACEGDGGGPLVCEDNGQWYQVGIISFGIGCGRKNTPGVYSHVSVHERWIRNVMLQHP